MLFTKHVKYILITSLCWANLNLGAQTLEADLETVFNNFQLMGMSVHVSAGNAAETYNFGLRDFDRDLPINDATHYRIASISKAFTALGIMKLYDQGEIDLDEDIATYLGYPVRNPGFPNTVITARMLLSHQSSLQDGSGYNNFLNATFSQNPIPNINELIMPDGNFYTTNMWRTETPGSYFAYSNVNFGMLGTVLEAISNQRFDIYMKAEILEPLSIQGSFNVQDLGNINDVAALYRYQSGAWQPQQDNYEGVLPSPPDLSGYIPGTNGLFFGPQGALRCTAEDLGLFLEYLNSDGATSSLTISANILQEMKAIAWDYNGSNGDTYGGLFNRWGLGLHHANVATGDAICPSLSLGTFQGHAGEAYGLVSDAFYVENQNLQFSLLINGSQTGYQIGSATSFYTVEEAIFSVLCSYFDDVLLVEDIDLSQFTIAPNPARASLSINHLKGATFTHSLFTIEGKIVAHSEDNRNTSILDVSTLPLGVYFLKITTQNGILTKKIIVE